MPDIDWSVRVYAVETVQRQNRLQRWHREVAQTESRSVVAGMPTRPDGSVAGNGSSGTAYASQNEFTGMTSKLVECSRIWILNKTAAAVPHGMARGRVAVSIQEAGVDKQRLLTL